MEADILGSNRLKGPESDVQGQGGDCHAFFLDPPDQFPGEMKPCRGSGDGTLPCSINRLISFDIQGGKRIARSALDVWRQRHPSTLFDQLLEGFRGVEPDYHDPVSLDLFHHPADLIVQQDKPADLRWFGGFQQTKPRSRRFSALVVFQNQQFNPAAGILFPFKAGGYDTGIVYDQQIPRAELLGDIMEMPVADRPAPAVEHQKPRGVSSLTGDLSDQSCRQIEIVVIQIKH
ncbi:hypothetical protein TRIP_B50424 [uncultured Desulfatiglans sp.]|nr:hypothetical protein TRIP_B50424 [uncultured Desulfatiglans sp.]